MEKILVQWSDGRWKGTTSFVKKSAVKKGTIVVGEKVGVTWGKAKKTYNAQVLEICSRIHSADVPQQDANNEEPFTFELASSAPEQAVELPSPSQPTLHARQEGESILLLMEKMDKLTDAMSRVEARLLCRLDTLEEAVKKISESCIPISHIDRCPVSLQPLYRCHRRCQHCYHYLYLTARENSNSPIPVVQDAPSRANIISPSVTVGEYRISGETLNLAMQGCCSQRNLAAQLAVKVYTQR